MVDVCCRKCVYPVPPPRPEDVALNTHPALRWLSTKSGVKIPALHIVYQGRRTFIPTLTIKSPKPDIPMVSKDSPRSEGTPVDADTPALAHPPMTLQTPLAVMDPLPNNTNSPAFPNRPPRSPLPSDMSDIPLSPAESMPRPESRQRHLDVGSTDNSTPMTSRKGSPSMPRSTSFSSATSDFPETMTHKGVTLLYFHGNGEDLAKGMSKVAEISRRTRCDVLAVEFEGYSLAEGQPSQKALYEDAEAGLQYLVGTGVALDDIVVFGRSLGSGPAVELATRHPGLAGLILQSPPASLLRTSCCCSCGCAPLFSGVDAFRNVEKVGKINFPVFVMHGTLDFVVPVRNGRAIHSKLLQPYPPLWVEGAGHNDVEAILGGKEYYASIRKFVLSLRKKVAPPKVQVPSPVDNPLTSPPSRHGASRYGPVLQAMESIRRTESVEKSTPTLPTLLTEGSGKSTSERQNAESASGERRTSEDLMHIQRVNSRT
eukprot:Hpha_TRINITY_DN22418_c0_g1::TRINITY_DN22418_c0_g1_i1::g.94943::m.94943